jgi:tetratricopeptide (TPR) repeat protein
MQVALFSSTTPYDRNRILAAAGRASARGRRRRAIALYRRLLSVETNNAEIHRRLAPLLARSGQHFDAWQSFRVAACDLIRQKRAEQALASYREAARCLPQKVEAWQATSTLERQLGRKQDAFQTLLEGRRAFKGRRQRAEAIAMLRAAREIEPWNPDVVRDLARLLARSDQAPEALAMLDQLAQASAGRELRRLRGAQWRIARTLSHTWLWLQAALTASREPALQPVRSTRSARSARSQPRSSNVVALSR